MMEILTASAGSGKTYTLAKTYIRTLLQSAERYEYRHVLAVTFTNKATGEMKDRILKELSVLSSDTCKSPYFNDFVPEICPDEATLRQRSEAILLDILHDYSAFSVSTIDKFFQKALKAFAKEIGYYASYQVELDKDSLIEEAVDRMLDGLTEQDKDLLDWMIQTAHDSIENGDSVFLAKDLVETCKRLKSAEFVTLAEKAGIDRDKAYSKESVKHIKDIANAVYKSFQKDMRTAAKQACDAMNAAGVSVADSSRNSLAPLERIRDARPDFDVLEINLEAFINKCNDPATFFKKADQLVYPPRLGPSFMNAVAALADIYDKRAAASRSAALILKTISTLGIAGEFFREFDKLVKEKNVMSLDDGNSILKKIIAGSDAPFVYEKLGVRYEHFLLDEFQDTSRVQWDNFLPLLRESDSYGRDNLVVGDVKQSIYRWRDSDWHLLYEDLPKQFPLADKDTLESNYRSLPAVVYFNNDFFKYLSEDIDKSIQLPGEGEVSAIYESVEQEVAEKVTKDDPSKGHVKVCQCDKLRECDAVLDAVREAMDGGAHYNDIAVLVRKHAQGQAVASTLIEAGIPVISDDSLTMKSSMMVRRLMSMLSCVDNPKDEINNYLANVSKLEFPREYHSLVDLCESMIRILRADNPQDFDAEVLYVQSFMDCVQDWTSIYGNKLTDFLKYMEDRNPNIVSPEDANAVTIMTIHKSKGLEFPCVIVPFLDKLDSHDAKANIHWCHPEVTDAGSKGLEDMIYPVNISKKLKDSYFSADYEADCFNSSVDDINMAYVAFTRACKTLYVISSDPKTDSRAGALAKRMDTFCQEYGYEFGEPYDFSKMKRKTRDFDQSFTISYPSIPMVGQENTDEETPVGERTRLKFSTDAADFFGADGSVSLDASPRLRGIVLHDILAKVEAPEQLQEAVEQSVRDGRMNEEEGRAAFSLLSERVAAHKEWFSLSSDAGRNEVSVIDTDGETYRPDRVIIDGGRVTVIDYKFGTAHGSYRRQVRHYMDIYRRMGYPDVSGFLWYVNDDEVVKL